MVAAPLGSFLMGEAKLAWRAAQEHLRPFKSATFTPNLNEPTTLLEAYVGSAFDPVRGESVGKRSSRISELAYRKLQHQFKSRHYVSFRLFLPPDPFSSRRPRNVRYRLETQKGG